MMLNSAHIRPKKSLGQHFLTDKNIANKIIDAAGITEGDIVVEIGPGNGILTALLAEKAKKVVAIEIDERLIENLRSSLARFSNVEIIQKDALKFTYQDLPHRFKVVANLPYYITTPIIFRLLEAKGMVISMTLMMQREVAERIVAGPGGKDYGVLSIAVQFYAEPKIDFIVPPTVFNPRPKVSSAVVSFNILKKVRVKTRDEEFFFKVVRAGFAQRRKTLRNTMKAANLGISADVLEEAFKKCEIEPTRRGETLSISEFAKLADQILVRLLKNCR
ncbi:MAG: 16S rRNA (adenine(1518)-N(6)/adenine(1519)-N(6))-dimethyltransferase RsmA [Nitrospirae bacterium]|nr:16S rRNA (adenine(1518)-N(6)/adenine(1519)-N(6))-dimethyltransferase RsmA [Nitrospirota bacterium]